VTIGLDQPGYAATVLWRSGLTGSQSLTARPATNRAAHVAVLLLLFGVVVAACATDRPVPSGATSVSRPVVGLSIQPASRGLDPDSGLPLVALSDLPPEAMETMGLIGAGGPYPYRQDGAVFENREGLLPDADLGYYHEYTVVTPGSADRGARRIVVGNQGEAYWSDDHYASYSRIAP
jgi:ribonuclease T1